MAKEDLEKGYYEKYHITKRDGTPMDPNAKYFVLRFDKDDVHGEASREALKAYAKKVEDAYPQLALDIYEILRVDLN